RFRSLGGCARPRPDGSPHRETAPRARTRCCWWCLRCRSGSRGSCHRPGQMLVTRRLGGEIVTGELSDPAFWIGKETNRGETGSRPHIEPMLGTVGHADQVMLLAQHRIDFVADVKIKQTLPPHEEAHFIFTVAMLVQELLAQLFAARMIRVQTDDVRRLKTVFLLQSFHFLSIGSQNFVIASVSRQWTGGPALEAHAYALQDTRDFLAVLGFQHGCGRFAFTKDGQSAHRLNLIISISQLIRNSMASTWRRQSAMVSPQVYRP